MESLQLLVDMFLGIFQVLMIVWPVWLVLGLFLTIRIGFRLYQTYRLSKAGMANIDKINGKDSPPN